MPIEDQVKVLESEFKLIKSELRQTLIGVRDFLLDLKVPLMQEESLNSELSPLSLPPSEPGQFGEAGNGPGMSDKLAAEPPAAPFSSDMDNNRGPIQSNFDPEDEPQDATSDETESFDFDDENTGVTAGEIPTENEDDTPLTNIGRKKEIKTEENYSSASPVNMLANLIRWAAVARQEIGTEQLPVFLDVYAVSGNLSSETREIILHLAEIATDAEAESKIPDRNRLINEQIALLMEISGLTGPVPAELKVNLQRLTELLIHQSLLTNKSNIWSQLLLELHGILVGQGSNLRPLPMTDIKSETGLETDVTASVPPPEPPPEPIAEEIHPKKKTVKPAKLRLVFPVDDGSEQELDLGNLFISSEASEDDSNRHQEGNGYNQYSIV